MINIDPEEAKNGVGRVSPRCGPAYDQSRNLVFVPRDRSDNLKNRELLQVFRFDAANGEFVGRQSVPLPKSMTAKHNATFIDVAPELGLIAVGATTFWVPQESRSAIYLLQYESLADETSGDAVISTQPLQVTTDLTMPAGGKPAWTLEPTAAVITSRQGRAIMIVASGNEFRKSDELLSAGLYLFDLGEVGGPYEITSPRKRIPLLHGVTELEIVGSQLIASARGIHCFDLDEVLASLDLETIPQPRQVIPLPYDTHGFDSAMIEGGRVLFVAGGRNGLDTFALVSSRSSSPEEISGEYSTPLPETSDSSKRVLLATGQGVRHLGCPAVNSRFEGCVWAVLQDGREAILHWGKDRAARQMWLTDERIVSLGRPAINDRGEIAVWAGNRDGTESILRNSNGLSSRHVMKRFSHLSNVQIADDGKIAFAAAEHRQHPDRAIAVVDKEGNVGTVYRESHSEKRTIGTGIHGDFVGDFAIAPDGRVAFVVQHGPRKPHLYSWRSEASTNHGSPGQHLQEIAFARNSKQLTFRLWKDEVMSQSMLELTPGTIGEVNVLAHRRKSYGNPPVNPGDFLASRADSKGNVVFATVENSQSGRGVSILGNQLWLAKQDDGPPTVLIKPGDQFAGAEVLNARFVDGFSDDGWIATTLDVRTSDGKLGQWLVQILVIGP